MGNRTIQQDCHNAKRLYHQIDEPYHKLAVHLHRQSLYDIQRKSLENRLQRDGVVDLRVSHLARRGRMLSVVLRQYYIYNIGSEYNKIGRE